MIGFLILCVIVFCLRDVFKKHGFRGGIRELFKSDSPMPSKTKAWWGIAIFIIGAISAAMGDFVGVIWIIFGLYLFVSAAYKTKQ